MAARADTVVMELRLGIQGSGQLVGDVPPPEHFRDVARLAEEAGFDSLWAGEHISFENPILDVTVALASFAAVTSRIAVGAGVVLLPLRPPALVAKEFASLDYISGGRVVLGVGVGGEGPKDFEAVGVSAGERGARTDEAMLALRELFSRSPASFAGRFSRFEGISIEPRPAQPGGPPLWVGGRSPAALARAGRLGDGWLPIWISPERYARGWDEVRRHAEAAGRDADLIVPAAVVPTLAGPDPGRARAEMREHLSRRYGTAFSPEAVERYAIAGTAEECAERALAYADAGVRHLVFNPAVEPPRVREQIELLAECLAAVAEKRTPVIHNKT
jgi:probable F420-dependent oxidoreductase